MAARSTEASATPSSTLKEIVLSAARLLDSGQTAQARAALRQAPLERADVPLRLIAAALWRRIALSSAGERIAAAFSEIAAAIKNEQYVWHAYRAIPVVEAAIGASDAASVYAVTLWDRTLKSPPAFFNAVLELMFRGGGDRCADAWDQYLAANKSFIPPYWAWLLLTKTFSRNDRQSMSAAVEAMLERTDRADLAPLFDVYFLQMRQDPVAEIVRAAVALEAPSHRAAVADYVIGMGYMPDELPVIVAAYAKLVAATPQAPSSTAYMSARLANAQGRWPDAVAFAADAEKAKQLAMSARLLKAHALTRLHRTAEANRLLDDILADEQAPQDAHARATFVRVITRHVEAGIPTPDQADWKTFPNLPGRPLAQSLWIGPKLRWIERLAIKSYLDNGWRFQLYVYEEPDGVPDGCEILDASAIVPENEVFREGPGSKLHAGSVGAFSDLFRYKMLHDRGGMWTDTDVINLKKFDPDGQRFVCTELSDAGFVTLNGAMMAAPAKDPFVARAYERASQLIESEKMFFTRIGPYLLAELVIEAGIGSIDLMPPGFLSPVNWMNTGSLLQPYDDVMRRTDFATAVNLHTYTEMWRVLGLGLDRPPDAATFLGRLYADRFGDDAG